MPYSQNYLRGNYPFEVQKGAASILFTGPGNHILLFAWSLEGKTAGIGASDDEELKSEILTIF
jgi:hypothetical protein